MSDPTRKRGLGVAAFFHGVGDRIDQPELFVANLELASDATVTLHLDADEIDRDAELELARLVGTELGVPAGTVSVATRPSSQGEGPRLSIAVGAFMPRQAVRQACFDVRAHLIDAAHAVVTSESASLEVVDGQVWCREPAKFVASIPELVEALQARGQLCLGWGWQERLTGVANPLTSQGYAFDQFQWVTQLAEVDVDTETGRVQLLRWVLASYVEQAHTPRSATHLREVATGPKSPGELPSAFDEPMLFEVASGGPRILESQWVMLNSAPAPHRAAVVQESEPALIPVTAAVLNAIDDAVGARVTDTPAEAEAILAAMREAQTDRQAS